MLNNIINLEPASWNLLHTLHSSLCSPTTTTAMMIPRRVMGGVRDVSQPNSCTWCRRSTWRKSILTSPHCWMLMMWCAAQRSFPWPPTCPSGMSGLSSQPTGWDDAIPTVSTQKSIFSTLLPLHSDIQSFRQSTNTVTSWVSQNFSVEVWVRS